MKYSILVLVFFASCMGVSREEGKPEYNEMTLKAFVFGMSTAPRAVDSLGSILAAASKDSVVFRKTVTFLTEPFGSPNSSYRNQQLYSLLLERMIGSNWYSAVEKDIARRRLTLLGRNNIGQVAVDFPYTTPRGELRRMYELHPKFLLLYFNNPECEACKQMKAALSQSTIIQQKVATGELQVLSIYMGADKKNWRTHLGEYPAEWLQGIGDDATLYKANLYDLNAIPTMYLLDKDKKVLLKDYFGSEEVEGVVR